MKEKKLIGYKTLKEACKEAREIAIEKDFNKTQAISIFQERDGSYTVKPKNTKNGTFICAVDKSGKKYKIVYIKMCGHKKIMFKEIQ